MPETPLSHRTDRLLFHLAWASAAAIFLSVGWTAMQSWDPKGPVSILTCGQSALMMIEVVALAAVASSLATVLSGRRFADAGVFSVGIALTLVSLRGQSMTYLLINDDHRSALAGLLAAESVFWCLVMMVAMVSSGFVIRWLTPESSADSNLLYDRMSAFSMPAIRRALGRNDSDMSRDTVASGAKHVAIVVVIAFVLVRVLAAGALDREIRHGQACFALAMGFYFASNRAQAMFPVVSNIWACAAGPITAAIAYLFAWGVSSRVDVSRLSPLPPSTFLGILPIAFVGLGTAAVLLSRWKAMSTHHYTLRT
jgi:hypothetical protein